MHDAPTAYRRRDIAARANDLFERAWREGQLKRLWAWLRGESRQLPLLSDIEAQYVGVPVRELGLRPVRLEQIIGTQGKISFDKDFLPLQRRSKSRWVSVAIGVLTDPISLPPADVVQVGQHYYVGDGNHRVSVAKALNNLYIDADVTQWVVDGSEPASS